MRDINRREILGKKVDSWLREDPSEQREFALDISFRIYRVNDKGKIIHNYAVVEFVSCCAKAGCCCDPSRL